MAQKKIMKHLAIFIVCAVLLCSNVFADMSGPFPDVPEDAAYADAVTALYELEIISGDENGNFNPNKTISRAEAATIICRMLGVTDNSQAKKSSFSDVPNNHWAAGYVTKAAELGIISGYGNGKFGPGDSVTYEQMIKMLVCAWGYGDEAQARGGWPNGYISVAEDFGVLKDISYVRSNSAPRSAVALMCNNVLSVAPANEYVEE